MFFNNIKIEYDGELYVVIDDIDDHMDEPYENGFDPCAVTDEGVFDRDSPSSPAPIEKGVIVRRLEDHMVQDQEQPVKDEQVEEEEIDVVGVEEADTVINMSDTLENARDDRIDHDYNPDGKFKLLNFILFYLIIF